MDINSQEKNKVSDQLFVFFEDPFWIGIFERLDNDKLSVSKVTFGAEPKDYELYAYILKNYDTLRFSPAVENVVEKKEKVNPKRRQREVKKQMGNVGISTKSQQALQLQHEQNKCLRKEYTREQKEADKERMFALKQQKRREKHKGR